MFQDEDEGIDLRQHRNDEKRGIDPQSENELAGPYMYELYAIMIHSGSASGGHYYAYIKDLKTEQWLCFNDQSVSVVSVIICLLFTFIIYINCLCIL